MERHVLMAVAVLLKAQLIVRRILAAPESLSLIIYDLAGLFVIAVAIYGPYIWLKWLMIILSLIPLGFGVVGFYYLPLTPGWAHVLSLLDFALSLWVISFLYRDIRRRRPRQPEVDTQ
jgi:membrane protein implicated in regulation of membrane protease activity